MSELVFESKRRFNVFSFQASHGLLLLRSPKSNESHTRIDILFRDVRAMELRTFCSGGIFIKRADAKSIEGLPSRPKDTMEPGHQVFIVGGPGWSGFVVSGRVDYLEDEGTAMGPSTLIGDGYGSPVLPVKPAQ